MNIKLKKTRRNAKKIIQKAREKNQRLLSESYLLKCIQEEANKIKQQVLNECKEIKHKSNN